MVWRTAVLSLIPGAGHVDLGRAKRGLVYFFLFAFFVNGALVAPHLGVSRGGRVACALAAAGIWVAAFYGAARTAARAQGPPPSAAGAAPETAKAAPAGPEQGK